MRSTASALTAAAVLACLICCFAPLRAHAAVAAYLTPAGGLYLLSVPGDGEDALAALAAPPAQAPDGTALSSAVPPGTQLVSFGFADGRATVDYSSELLAGGLDDARSEAVYAQVRMTLQANGQAESARVIVDGKDLYTYLPPAQPVKPRPRVPGVTLQGAGSALAGRSISLSPGHGLKWDGGKFSPDRPVYCAPLNEEDFHNLEMGIYLEEHLRSDSATLFINRCTDKSFGTYSVSGKPWWQMGPSYWLQYNGYPCSVYANATGDCTLGTGASEASDNIRSRGLMADYDNVDIHVAIHTNGWQGDCYGSGCPRGTSTYYDSSPEHAQWGDISYTLAAAIQNSVMDVLRTKYPADSAWQNRGVIDFDGGNDETRRPDRAAALIELAFHDSCSTDAVWLRDNFFRSAAMWGMYRGICNYFGVTNTWDFYSCEIVAHDLPVAMRPGATKTVHITMRNRGVLWDDERQLRLGAVGDSDAFTATTRANVGREVPPGDTITFAFDLTAPTTPGTYLTDWQMLREGVQWFGPVVQQQVFVDESVETEPPTIPSGLQATPVSESRVDLSWNASTDNVGVTGYRLYRDGTLLAFLTGTSYSDTSCQGYTTYIYEVSAYDASGNESGLSDAVQVTTPAQLDFIIDNVEANFTGSWATAITPADFYGTNYRWAASAATSVATARFTPAIQRPGPYDVYQWHSAAVYRTQKAPYTIHYAGGTVTVNVDQTANGGQWVRIAQALPFDAGTGGYVELGNGTGENSKLIVADAVRFTFVDTSDVTGPGISGISVSPPLAAAGDSVTVTLSAADPSGVASVTANGAALSSAGGDAWTGSIPADSGLGPHAVEIVATDGKGNTSQDSSASYATTRVLWISTRALAADPLVAMLADEFLFGLWGRVVSAGTDSLELDEGTGLPVRVMAAGHGLSPGDYASARGIWDAASTPPALTAQPGHVLKLD